MNHELALFECTNAEQLWHECGLDTNKHALWHLHWPGISDNFLWDPSTVIQRQASWLKADKIFVIGQEGVLSTAPGSGVFHDDARIHVWDSVIGLPHERSRTYLFWFDWVKEVTLQTGALDHLADARQKSFVFECLLGKRKPWRDWIYARASSHPAIMVSYQDRAKWISGCDIDHDVDYADNNTSINYRDQQGCISGVLFPWKIYNDSWFSIISESTHSVRFLTEKTAKPLLAGRLFVWFGAHQGLLHLQKLGFRTFGNIIDESYDGIVDTEQRWEQAWQQVEKLLKMDPIAVYDQIREQVNHNQKLFLSLTPKKDMIKQIRQLVGVDA